MISLREYARHRRERGLPGTTHSAVRRAINSGRLVDNVVHDAAGKPAIRDAAAADLEWIEATRPRSDGSVGTDPAGVPPLMVSRAKREAAAARREAALADLAELDAQKRKGELVEAAGVEEEYVAIVSAVKTKLLGVPTRLRQRLPHLAPDDIALLDDLIREALEDLADGEASAAAKDVQAARAKPRKETSERVEATEPQI